MSCNSISCTFLRLLICTPLLLGTIARADTTDEFMAQLAVRDFLEPVKDESMAVRNHEVGLGALQKSDGRWRFKHSERITGQLSRATWQVLDGYTSAELVEDLDNQLKDASDVRLLFECDGRACGSGSQWASRVFGERILYGRAEAQRYRVYALNESSSTDEGVQGPRTRLLVYAAMRTADRQYVHIELLGEESLTP